MTEAQKIELEIEMKRNKDTAAMLAEYLGITTVTLSRKKNGYRGSEFTRSEIKKIILRYSLNHERTMAIFFD